ncbi:MAG: UDP-2,4-diacetamido-2,4,6-trideoxy-beta-L-altropyranose hydrolase [Comamonadaceae bacterium]|nr:MAG: UDP-2,4-diacetamido-2,4,6-trideoxy-beta-L-altropyranose hydrolase [Comamonadaceae bacterium]
MNVVFRVDASNLIGTGHVMRCRTLGSALQLRGAHIRFITRKHSGHLAEVLARDGFQVELLPEPAGAGCEAGYAGWLGVSQEEDARQTIAALKGLVCDLLVVDHYALDSVWESLLSPHASKIMVIDDLANRAHACDLLLDQNYSLSGPDRDQPWVPATCQLLLGPRYALLRPEYAQIRESMAPRTGSVQRVLIYMGGSDSANITWMVLRALSSSRLQHLAVDVVIGPNFVFQIEITEMVKARPRTQAYGQQPHLAGLMATADIVVGAGGATTWERLCLGVPSLVVSIADNQVPACEALASSGLIRYLGRAENVNAELIEEALVQELSSVVDPCARQMKGHAVVDGMGTCRVLEAVRPTRASELEIRAARATDVMTYFNWVNDPMVRASALQSSPIDFASHVRWFAQRLADPGCSLLVMEADGLPLGQVRFEWQGGNTTIDYSLDELVRGRGWGRRLIELGVQSLTRGGRDHRDIRAVVKSENVASRRTFASLGFTELPPDALGNIHYRMLVLGHDQMDGMREQEVPID